MNREAARGALLGLAVGDALGTTYEFQTSSTAPPYPALAAGPATDVVGGGPFELSPGAITDDTQLATALARSLATREGFDAEDVARRYVAWSDHAFDIGNQTLASIRNLEAGTPALEAGLACWRAGGRKAAGNGSLMRTAPIGVALATRDIIVVAHAAVDDSLITHADPRCVLATAAFDAAIASAVVGAASVEAMLAAARAGGEVGAAHLHARLRADEMGALESARAELLEDLAVGAQTSPGVHGGGFDMYRTQGFVRVALRLAFWHLARTSSWRDALVDVASRGGDADTNAAIVGALLGARDGESAIPAAWRERVLAATQRGPEAWAEAHHPKHLLALSP